MRLLETLLLTAGLCAAANLKLGSPLTLKEPTPVSKVASSPETYVGKTLQVKGKITEVCQMMGCWISLSDAETGQLLKINVHDGDIVFPKDSVGKLAIAEGKLVKMDLTREQVLDKAKHEAEEQGRKFDPASVKAGATLYQIEGTGALILQ